MNDMTITAAPKLKLTLCSTHADVAALHAAGIRSARMADSSAGLFRHVQGQLTLDPALGSFGQFTLALDRSAAVLRDDLAVRLGDLMCRWVPWPDGCNNAAETLRDHGPDGLKQALEQSRPMWIDEVCLLSDIPESPPQKGYTTGFEKLDEHGFRLIRPAFMPVIGPYASGKSILIRQLCCNLWRLHGWRTGITAFEEKVKPRYVRDLRRHMIGGEWIDAWGEVKWRPIHPDQHTPEMITEADKQIEDAFRFIRRKRNTVLDADRLVDRIEYAVRVYGLEVMVIDPVNEIDHIVPFGETKTDYLGRFMMKLKQLADDYSILMITLAHPAKEGAEKRLASGKMLTLNDAADTANYGSKADIGWCVWRPSMKPDCPTYLNMDKLKDTEIMGDPTACELKLDKGLGRFNITDIGYQIFDKEID